MAGIKEYLTNLHFDNKINLYCLCYGKGGAKMNTYYLVDAKERLLNAHVVTGKAYIFSVNGRSLSNFSVISTEESVDKPSNMNLCMD